MRIRITVFFSVIAFLLIMSSCSINMYSDEQDNVPTEDIFQLEAEDEIYESNEITEMTEVFEKQTGAYVEETTTVQRTASEIEAEIQSQEVKIVHTEYIEGMFDDILSAIIQNDSATAIKNADLAFVAWDENNLPVVLDDSYYSDYNGYVKKCKYEGINLVSAAQYGEDSGLRVDSDVKQTIAKFKAIVVSYENFDGEIWENPLYDEWIGIYAEKQLKE